MMQCREAMAVAAGLAAALWLAMPAAAQRATPRPSDPMASSISGMVLDQSQPIANADVRLLRRPQPLRQQQQQQRPPTTAPTSRPVAELVAMTTTDSTGHFSFDLVEPGEYMVQVTARRQAGRSRVTLREGQSIEVRIVPQPAPGRQAAGRQGRGQARDGAAPGNAGRQRGRGAGGAGGGAAPPAPGPRPRRGQPPAAIP